MNTSILIRTDKSLKQRFEKQAKSQGLSMTFLLTSFMETYAENPNIVKTGLDEELIDQSWKSVNSAESLKALSRTLDAK